MTKRRKILLAFAGALILGVVLWVIFPPEPEPEPSYNGKTLSEWLAVPESNPTAEAQKAHAIRHIGTNAIPFLLKWIQYEQPRWKFKLFNYYSYYMKSPFPKDTAHVRSWDAAYAFRFLGQDARGAIPELKTQAINRKPGNFRAMMALGCLGKDGVSSIMEALTNHDALTRDFAIRSVPAMGTNARPVLPLLINLLTDSDSEIAQHSAHYLGELRLDPDRVIPGLTNSLLSSNANDRAVADALGKFGTAARPAVPALLNLLANPLEAVQIEASNALQKIAPEALNRATNK